VVQPAARWLPCSFVACRHDTTCAAHGVVLLLSSICAPQDQWQHSFEIMLTAVLAGAFGVTLFFFAGFHIWLVATGDTTIEMGQRDEGMFNEYAFLQLLLCWCSFLCSLRLMIGVLCVVGTGTTSAEQRCVMRASLSTGHGVVLTLWSFFVVVWFVVCLCFCFCGVVLVGPDDRVKPEP